MAALDQINLHVHPVYGEGNYSTLKIDGGYQEYAIVVPQRCEVIITRLTVPGESRETAVADMEALIATLDLACEVQIETPPPFYEPYLIDTDSPFAQSFTQAYQQQFSRQPPWTFMKGIADSNIYVAEGGIPTIILGPAGQGPHECDEYVEIDSLVPVAQVLHDCCLNYFGA